MRISLSSLFLQVLILNSVFVYSEEGKSHETVFIECSAAAVVSVSELSEKGDRVTSLFVVIRNNGKRPFTADPASFVLSYWKGTGKMERFVPLNEETLRKMLQGGFQRWASAITDSTPTQTSESVITDTNGRVIGQVEADSATPADSERQKLNMLGSNTVLPGHQVTGMVYFKQVEETYTKLLLCNSFPLE